jgi:hypothetical protein
MAIKLHNNKNPIICFRRKVTTEYINEIRIGIGLGSAEFLKENVKRQSRDHF